jgi:hypothetical protein
MPNDPLKYAKEVYAQIHDELSQRKPTDNGQPTLIVIGEEHRDYSEVSKNEPAAQAIYAELSALRAAVDIAGADKVVLSIELSEDGLDRVKEMLTEAGGIPKDYEEMAALHSIKYAMDNGIIIVPTDPLAAVPQNERKAGFDEVRNQAQIEYINGVGRMCAGAYVVHIGGNSHIANLQGFSDYRVVTAGGDLVQDPANNPLTDTYGRQFHINAAFLSQEEVNDWERRSEIDLDAAAEYKYLSAEFNYVTNAKNALQVNPPAYADSLDPSKMVDLVTQAAAEHGTEAEQPVLDVKNDLNTVGKFSM